MSDEKILKKILEKVFGNEKLNEEDLNFIELKIKRKCNKCNEIKKMSEFYRMSVCRGGHDVTCKTCKKKNIAGYNRARIERGKEQKRKEERKKKREEKKKQEENKYNTDDDE